MVGLLGAAGGLLLQEKMVEERKRGGEKKKHARRKCYHLVMQRLLPKHQNNPLPPKRPPATQTGRYVMRADSWASWARHHGNRVTYCVRVDADGKPDM